MPSGDDSNTNSCREDGAKAEGESLHDLSPSLSSGVNSSEQPFDQSSESAEGVDPQIVQEEISDLKQTVDIIATVAERSQFWSGPIPPHDQMQGYKDVDPYIVSVIVEDFQRSSLALVAAQEHQQQLEDRKLKIQEREQEFRQSGEQSDIRFRWASGGVLWLVIIGIALGFLRVLWIFAANPSWTGTLGLAVAGTVMAILATIIGGKGRLTQIESDTQVSSLKSLPDIVKSLGPGDGINGKSKTPTSPAPTPPE